MKKIRNLVWVFFSFLIIFVQDLKAENSFILWKISKNSSTVYLAPTIHMLPKDFYPLNNQVDKIMDESDYLVVELDAFSDKTLKIIQNEGMKYMCNEGNKKIKELIPEDKYKELKAKMFAIGLNLDALKAYNPGVLSMTVSQMIMMYQGYRMDSGLDLYFLKKAKETNKPILELESPLFQLERLFSMDFDLQMEGLNEMLSEQGKKDVIMVIGSFTNYVKNGDLEGFEKEFAEETSRDERLKEYYEGILDERNVGMADKIEGFIKKGGTYFVAVGGGHYVGPNNIRELLEKKGYKIERVRL